MGSNGKLERQKQKQERLGETRCNNKNEKMTIIKYNGYMDIDVQFEDGSVVESTRYSDFKNGEIRKPENRLGEVQYNISGDKMTIVEYFSATNVTIQFENGLKVFGVRYSDFKNGAISNPIKKPENRLGEISYNTYGSKMVIIEYNNAKDITVQFENGYKVFKATYTNFKNGTIRSPYDRTVFGIGYLGEGGYCKTINNKPTTQYNLWKAMLSRCYNLKNREKNPTYKDCTVCEEWLNFSNFVVWYDKNHYKVDDEVMAIDKDILIKGNKVYSPETCIFVPQRINTLFVKRQNYRGDLPIGVYLKRGMKYNQYGASCSEGDGKPKYLGYFSTIDEAFNIYKTEKEKVIKQVADEYKDKIPQKLYDAMYRYVVQITD